MSDIGVLCLTRNPGLELLTLSRGYCTRGSLGSQNVTTCYHLTVKADCKDGLELFFGMQALDPPSNHYAFPAAASYAQTYSGQREVVAQEIRI